MRFKMRLLFEEEMKKKLDRVQYCPEFKKLKEICNRHGIGLDVVIDSSMHIDMSNEGGINFCATYDTSLGHRWLISVAEIAQVELDVFTEQLSNVNEFYSCLEEAQEINIEEIYKFIESSRI